MEADSFLAKVEFLPLRFRRTVQCTFLDNTIAVEHAREYGHTHLAQVVTYAEMFQNKAILLIHFSAWYQVDEIEEAVSRLPTAFADLVVALTEGI